MHPFCFWRKGCRHVLQCRLSSLTEWCCSKKSAVAIWGSSDRKQQKVTVKTSWNAKKYTAVTDESGNWKVKVETPVYGGPYSMEVSDGESVHINNVLIGEVWLCSGQSNMDMRVSGRYGDPVIGSLDAIVTSGNPEVRMFMVGSKMTSEPLTDCEGYLAGSFF